MTVYIMNSMTIHDRAVYDLYLKHFMGVFRKFSGAVLAAQDHPTPMEGQWPYDRTILLSFPTRDDAMAWIESPEYQAIAKHRHAATRSNVIMLDGLPQRT